MQYCRSSVTEGGSHANCANDQSTSPWKLYHSWSSMSTMTAKEFAGYIALRHTHMRLNTWKVQAPNGHSVYSSRCHTGKLALTSTVSLLVDILRFGQITNCRRCVANNIWRRLLKAYLLVAVVSLFHSFAHSICTEADAKLCGYGQSVVAEADCICCAV